MIGRIRVSTPPPSSLLRFTFFTINQRKAEWLKCCDYVFHDRADNEVQAATDRRGDPAVNEASDDDNDSEEDELDTKYY